MADCILQSPPLLTYRVSDAKLSLLFFWRNGQVLPLLVLTLTHPSWALRSLPSTHPLLSNGEYYLSTKADVSRAYVAQVFTKRQIRALFSRSQEGNEQLLCTCYVPTRVLHFNPLFAPNAILTTTL